MDPKAALKFCNFKGFGEELQGLEVLRNFNLIIGKNNSGKSSVLDLVEHLISRDKAIPNNRWHKGSAPTIVLSASLTEEVVRRVFPEDTSLGGVPGRNHWEYGRQLVGLQLSWKPFASDPEKFQSIENLPDGTEPLSDIRDERSRVNFRRSLSSNTPSPFTGLEVVRISAERRITPEENEAEMVVEGNGTGVSNMIQAFLNRIELDSTLVEIVFLEALNEIFSPEAVFTRIVSQQIDNQKWEIYLEEEYKGRIGLSESGSGLQTVIIVLSHLLLRPVANNKTASDYFFCCEELENNLHPALQRKLLNYLFQKSVEQDIYFFVATHSNVAIDQFANSTNSQIVHVTASSGISTCRNVHSYVESIGVLNDLDVRASDILQCNCIVWVEGPSDRIYVNEWIKLWSDDSLVEGLHYQCVIYGGKLLAHFSASTSDEIEEIQILRTNRNCIMIIDSDKSSDQDQLNDTKMRMAAEIESANGYLWITDGKEIENYLPMEALNALAADIEIDQQRTPGKYENYFDYLNEAKEDVGDKYRKKKTHLADIAVKALHLDDWASMLDLNEKVTGVCDYIDKCNS